MIKISRNFRNEGKEKFPFYLVYCNSTGLQCSKCHWTRYCNGCIIPEDLEHIPYEFAKYVSIQWKYLPFFLKWSPILSFSRCCDASVFHAMQKSNPGRKVALADCFEIHGLPEILDSKATCGGCNVENYREKRILISRLPETLVINIKRFIQASNNRWVKDKSAVTFPLHNFNVGAYTTSGHSDIIYECTGVVIHRGEMEGGHYVCYCKRKGYWYFINDEDSTVCLVFPP